MINEVINNMGSAHSEGVTGNDILIVDDNPANLGILSTILKAQNYKVRPVPSGTLALKAVESMPPDLILLDVTMPDMNGYEVCSKIKENPAWAHIPIIFVTALTGTVDKVRGFSFGAVDYITKPYNNEEVKARVKTHLSLHDLQQNLQHTIERKVKELTQMQSTVIFSLAKLAQSRDDDTGRHLERVQEFCKILAQDLMENNYNELLTPSFIEMLYQTSPLHDIGKVAIPDKILLKPDKLTPEEFEEMKKHAAIGAENLNQIIQINGQNEFLNMGKVIARHHHEKWDGTGYPDGLKGTQIPIEARIMSLVDIYDALRSQRIYKPAFSHVETRDMLCDMKYKNLDPAIVESFLRVNEKFEAVYEELKS